MTLAWDFVLDVKPQQHLEEHEGSHGGEWHKSSYSQLGWRDEMHRTEKRRGECALINTSMGSLCFRLALTGKMPSCSWRSFTSFTSVDMLLLLGACQAPVSIPRPGRQGKTLLANWRHSGQVNSPLSTENPWRTWSFWKQTDTTFTDSLMKDSPAQTPSLALTISVCSCYRLLSRWWCQTALISISTTLPWKVQLKGSSGGWTSNDTTEPSLNL